MASEQRYCVKCGRTKSKKDFYQIPSAPDGYANLCKECYTMHIDNYDPSTYLPLLEELDIPYIKTEWDALLEKYGQDLSKMTGTTILGRYISKMKLVQWRDYHWCDTERLANEAEQKRREALRQAGFEEDAIDAQLAMDRGPQRPESVAAEGEGPIIQPDELMDSLTEDDKNYLRIKWGDTYRASEWIKMEQLYEDMMASYDIQSAGHRDTLIMVCKASLKANQCIDSGDIEGFQKMSKVYDTLMKSGKFRKWTEINFMLNRAGAALRCANGEA